MPAHEFKEGEYVSRSDSHDAGRLWMEYASCYPVDKRAYLVVEVQSGFIKLEGSNILWRADRFYPAHESQMPFTPAEPADNVVTAPKHYMFFPDIEAIEIIASSMSEEGFRGFCLGNRLKYRLRAGNKDKLEQDIAKSDFYIELFNKHKHLCKG